MIKYDNGCWKLGEDQRSPVTSNDHPAPEKRKTWKDYTLEAIALAAMAGTLIASCGSCYQYATKDREKAYQEKQEERQYDIQK